jgi:chaperonin GroES
MIQLLGDRVLVRRSEAATTTPAGLVIPDNAKELPTRGVVISLSESFQHADFVKVNSTVLFNKYAGSEIKFQGETYLMLTGDDVIGVVPE